MNDAARQRAVNTNVSPSAQSVAEGGRRITASFFSQEVEQHVVQQKMCQLGFVCIALNIQQKRLRLSLRRKKIDIIGENLSIVTRLEPTSEHHLCDARID